ncbi:putative F-box/LRR-repeat protein 9 [Salvia hispanica]|uniref:putative F-box/LRR-repeat protein 9 n=1 Tax=Salvia hispanica TaxID=49212 RepID=UPI002008F7FF|nr:putative F-box/LRR-repeat protein 9 [Salvia hispanica]
MKPRRRNPKKSKKLKRGSSSSAPPSPPWIELPEHLTADIRATVCKTWWRVCQNPATWRSIDLDYRRPAARDFGNICLCGGCGDDEICSEGGCTHDDICRCWENKFNYLVRRAVDLSQGQLQNLKLGVWYLYGLLDYVADRSCQLRSLTVVQCDDDYHLRRLIMGIEKQPQLEELHLMMNPMITSNEFETIGIACPMLKSFSYHNCHSKDSDFSEGLAFSEHVKAIGKTMPNLRHLRLCEHRMGYEGLEAILEGCPHLKSLDLRLCSAFEKFYYYSGQRRSARERKDLWLHTDSISLMDWIKKRKDRYDINSEYVVHPYYCCDDIRGEYY